MNSWVVHKLIDWLGSSSTKGLGFTLKQEWEQLTIAKIILCNLQNCVDVSLCQEDYLYYVGGLHLTTLLDCAHRLKTGYTPLYWKDFAVRHLAPSYAGLPSITPVCLPPRIFPWYQICLEQTWMSRLSITGDFPPQPANSTRLSSWRQLSQASSTSEHN